MVGVPSLRREFKINFVVTKTQPILGADFLIAYNLNLNMRQKKLCDPVTQLSAILKSKKSSSILIRVAQSSCQGFIEKKFKNLVTAPDYSYLPGKMVTEHAIETSGPPIYSKPFFQ